MLQARDQRQAQVVAGGDDGGDVPWAVIVLEISDGRIAGINNFLDTERLFPLFGLPERLGQPQ